MAVKFETNIPQTLYFPWGDCKPKEGKYGVQMMYAVHLVAKNGEKDFLFASDSLQGVLSSMSLRDKVVTITKKEKGTKNYWEVQVGPNVFSSLDAPNDAPTLLDSDGPPPVDPLDTAFPIPIPQPPTQARTDAALTVADYALSLKECLEGAEWAWSQAMINFRTPINPTSEDIRALAATLFIRANK